MTTTEIPKAITDKAEAIMDEFDLQGITDMTILYEGKRNERMAVVTAIGWPTELSAGIWGHNVTPYFRKPEDAIRWLVRHETEVRAGMPES